MHLHVVGVDERSIKTFVIQLAPLQVQYDKMWIIVYSRAAHWKADFFFTVSYRQTNSIFTAPFEDALLLLLHSALVNFRIDVAILIR